MYLYCIQSTYSPFNIISAIKTRQLLRPQPHKAWQGQIIRTCKPILYISCINVLTCINMHDKHKQLLTQWISNTNDTKDT